MINIQTECWWQVVSAGVCLPVVASPEMESLFQAVQLSDYNFFSTDAFRSILTPWVFFLVLRFSSCNNDGQLQSSRENNLEMTELSSVNKV